jgi:SSS family solute:Na+ symporter
LPAIVLGLYTRVLDHRALLAGWLVGIVSGTWMAATLELKSSIYPLHLFGYTIPGYAAVWSLIINIVISVGLSYAFRAFGMAQTVDKTVPEDYLDTVEG